MRSHTASFSFPEDFAHSELEWAVYGYHAFKDARPEDFFTLLRKRFSGSALIAAILFWGNRCPRDLEGLASKILNACEPIASPAERQQLQLLLMRAKARARPRVYAVNDAMGVNVAVVLERKASWTEAINGKERLQDFASALTLIASQFYMRLTPSQLLHRAQKAMCAELMQQRSELLYGWVQTLLFVCGSASEREEVSKGLHRLAEMLVENYNFNDAAAVVNALVSPCVARLQIAYVSGSHNMRLSSLRDLFSLESNYANYRNRINALPDTACVVPYLSVHLHDLAFYQELGGKDSSAAAQSVEAAKCLGNVLERFLRFQRNWKLRSSLPRLNLCSLPEKKLMEDDPADWNIDEERRSKTQARSVEEFRRPAFSVGSPTRLQSRSSSTPQLDDLSKLGVRNISLPDFPGTENIATALEAADMFQTSQLAFTSRFMDAMSPAAEPLAKASKRLGYVRFLFEQVVGAPIVGVLGDVETLVCGGALGLTDDNALCFHVANGCAVLRTGKVGPHALLKLVAYVLQLLGSNTTSLAKRLKFSATKVDAADVEVAVRLMSAVEKAFPRTFDRVCLGTPPEWAHCFWKEESDSPIARKSSLGDDVWQRWNDRAVDMIRRAVVTSIFTNWPTSIALSGLPPSSGSVRVSQTRTVQDAHFIVRTQDGDLPNSWNAVILVAHAHIKDAELDLRATELCRDEIIPSLAALLQQWNVTSSVRRAFADIDSKTSEFKKSGCSVAVALHKRDAETGNVILVTANVGDMGIELLCRDQPVRMLSCPHVGSNAEESVRITRDGGMIIQGLVGGLVPVTRAVGLHCGKKYLISEPHVSEVLRLPSDIPAMLYMMNVQASGKPSCGAFWSCLDTGDEVMALPLDADATVLSIRLC